MKQPTTIISFAVILVLSVVLGAWLFAVSRAKTEPSDQISLSQTQADPAFRPLNSAGQTTAYISARYGFSLVVPSEFSYQVVPPIKTESLLVRFSRTNKNTSEGHNRNTPDGFNTFADDVMHLAVYTNDENISSDQWGRLAPWIERNMPGETIVRNETRVVGLNTIVLTHQGNGVGGAVGQYLYFITSNEILVLISNDVSEETLMTIAESVSLK
ncbi:MAG: hypothetical protein WC497_02510 [Patescibacteria group bacterium]